MKIHIIGVLTSMRDAKVDNQEYQELQMSILSYDEEELDRALEYWLDEIFATEVDYPTWVRWFQGLEGVEKLL